MPEGVLVIATLFKNCKFQ